MPSNHTSYLENVRLIVNDWLDLKDFDILFNYFEDSSKLMRIYTHETRLSSKIIKLQMENV